MMKLVSILAKSVLFASCITAFLYVLFAFVNWSLWPESIEMREVAAILLRLAGGGSFILIFIGLLAKEENNV